MELLAKRMEAGPTPNFFIVGAPKAGTTALHSYLRQHPEMFLPELKEPQFFAADIRGDQRTITAMPEYLALFKEARTHTIGEASTCYLGSPEAPFAIRNFCPSARIVIMLRNPIDVMCAQHSERVFDGTEQIQDFAKALDSSEPRVCRSGPFRGRRTVGLSYRELTKFSKQVKRYIDVFGRSSVHVIVYEDFFQDPAAAYQGVLGFLQVSQNHQCSFAVVHANRQIRSPGFQDWLRHPPRFVRFLPAGMRHGIGSFLNRANTRFVARPALDKEFRKRLALEYASEVQELGVVIGRDLSRWTERDLFSRTNQALQNQRR